MKKIFHYLTIFISVVSGLLLFLSVPRLFSVKGRELNFGFETFIEALKMNFTQIIHPDLTQIIKQWTTTSIAERYFYTLKLVGLSLSITILAGILLSSLYIISPRRVRSMVKYIIDLSEAIPDLIVIFIIQFSVIMLYKETGLKFLRLYGLSQQPYVIHVITAAFLPSLFMAQFLIKQVEEEFQKDYIVMAKAKGIADLEIYFKHVLRNIVPITFIHVRTLIWVILSNIVLIEYIFVLKGFTSDLSKIYQVNTLTAISHCILIAIPIILLDLLIRSTAVFYRGKEDMTI